MKLWLTRPLPPEVEARAEAEFDVDKRISTAPLSPDELRSVATRLKTVGYAIAPQGQALVVAPEDGR